MGKRTAVGALYVGASEGVSISLNILSTIIVARILTPSDYGIIAMVSPIVGYLILFQYLGLNQAVIQSKTITEHQLSTLFWITMGASTLVALTLLCLAPALAWFYNDSRVGGVTAAYAVTVLLNGTTLQHIALLNRDLRFRALSAADILKSVSTFLATVALAYLLQNYWALWIGMSIGVIVNVVIVWIFDPWRPKWKFRLRETRTILSFGANIASFNLLNYLARNLDNVLIARVWGAEPVGLYDRSFKLMMFPLQHISLPLGRVLLPILGRLKDEPARYRRAYLLSLRMIALLIVPGVIVAAATSDRLIPFLLGDRWESAGPIFFWLSLAALAQPIANACNWLFISTGRTAALLRWGLLSTTATVLAFVIGLPWGAVGVACAYFCVQLVRIPVLFLWSTRETPIAASDMLAVLAPSVLGGGMAWLISTFLLQSLAFPILLFATLLLSYVLSLLFHLAVPAGRRDLLDSAAALFAAIAFKGFGSRKTKSRDRPSIE